MTRKIVLCADDYGLTRPINAAIRELLISQRINATSVMVVTPGFDRAEVEALVAAAQGAQIGLHVTLTAPFAPLTPFHPTRYGRFLPLSETLRLAIARRFDTETAATEIAAQVQAFAAAFGRAPDFLDGHQHVQLFPQIRDAFLRVAAEQAPRAWVRQCGRWSPLPRRLRDPKGLLLDVLSFGFRRRAERLGLVANAAFAGTYDFSARPDFAALFPSFLDRLPDGGLVMCHPGVSDGELERLDALTDQREQELNYFKSDAFPRALAEHGVALR
ncbi:MAG: ChbG/HpnK family deacetylase [Pseudolabrys sp.]|nr:ChbG/HpnK family deacetylase [Pseudolabrys sp.]